MLEITFNKQFFSHVFKNVHPWQTDQPPIMVITCTWNVLSFLVAGLYDNNTVFEDKVYTTQFNQPSWIRILTLWEFPRWDRLTQMNFSCVHTIRFTEWQQRGFHITLWSAGRWVCVMSPNFVRISKDGIGWPGWTVHKCVHVIQYAEWQQRGFHITL